MYFIYHLSLAELNEEIILNKNQLNLFGIQRALSLDHFVFRNERVKKKNLICDMSIAASTQLAFAPRLFHLIKITECIEMIAGIRHMRVPGPACVN